MWAVLKTGWVGYTPNTSQIWEPDIGLLVAWPDTLATTPRRRWRRPLPGWRWPCWTTCQVPSIRRRSWRRSRSGCINWMDGINHKAEEELGKCITSWLDRGGGGPTDTVVAVEEAPRMQLWLWRTRMGRGELWQHCPWKEKKSQTICFLLEMCCSVIFSFWYGNVMEMSSDVLSTMCLLWCYSSFGDDKCSRGQCSEVQWSAVQLVTVNILNCHLI